jgi:hypothetical protein
MGLSKGKILSAIGIWLVHQKTTAFGNGRVSCSGIAHPPRLGAYGTTALGCYPATTTEMEPRTASRVVDDDESRGLLRQAGPPYPLLRDMRSGSR